jgi:hypothetical protein
VQSSTPFSSPPLITRTHRCRAQDDPLRTEIAQIMGEARSRAEREVQADPTTPSHGEGGIRFLAVGRRPEGAVSGPGTCGKDAIVLLATYAREPQEAAARCSEAVRYLCAAPATMEAMGGAGEATGTQLRLSVNVESVGTISIECGGTPPLVHVAVTSPGYPSRTAFMCLGELQAACAAHFGGWDAALEVAKRSREGALSAKLQPLLAAVSTAFAHPKEVYDAEQAHLPFADLYFARPAQPQSLAARGGAGRQRPGRGGGSGGSGGGASPEQRQRELLTQAEVKRTKQQQRQQQHS